MVIHIPPHKHIIQNYQNALNLSTQTIIVLAVGTENPDPYTNATNVRNGSLVRQLILQFEWLAAENGGQPDAIDWYVWFNINGAQTRPSNTFPNGSHLKNQIFHQDGTMSRSSSITNVGYTWVPVNKWRLVIDIPRSYQQINLGDQIEFVMTTQTNIAGSDYKLTCIYKEIFP